MNKEQFEREMADRYGPVVCEHRHHATAQRLTCMRVIYPGWNRPARIFACQDCRHLIETEVKIWQGT